MEQITVQKEKSLQKAFIQYVIFFTVLIVIGFFLIFIANGIHGYIFYYLFYALIAAIVPSGIITEALSDVSRPTEIQLTDTDLTIIYKKRNKITDTISIPISDIKDVYLKLEVEVLSSRIGALHLLYYTFVQITVKNQDIIYFSVGTNNAPLGEGYSFFLNFIKFAAHLPNFKYKLKTNNPVIKADVEHFIKTGKRLSFLQKIKIELKNVSLFRRIITVLFLICIAVFAVSALGYIIFTFASVIF